jgi:hypothetical protein
MLSRVLTTTFSGLALLCGAATMFATPITVSDTNTETLFGSAIFRIEVNNGGGLQAATWQGLPGANSFAADYAFTLSYSVPAGDVIDSATLNLSNLVPVLVTATYDKDKETVSRVNSNQDLVWNVDYHPSFDGTVSGTYLTITSGAVSRTINASSASNLDLIALGFGSELASGTSIEIDWHQTLLLTADTSDYPHKKAERANAYRDFTVSGSVQGTAAAALTLNYSQPETDPVPEPATYGLVGVGLWLLGRARRRTR